MSATVIDEKIIRPKRFIAGATCPQCRQVDKMVVYTLEQTLQLADQSLSVREEEIMACVSCAYQQAKSALTTDASEHAESAEKPHKIDIKTLKK